MFPRGPRRVSAAAPSRARRTRATVEDASLQFASAGLSELRSRVTPATRWIRSYRSSTDVSTPLPTLQHAAAVRRRRQSAATTSPT